MALHLFEVRFMKNGAAKLGRPGGATREQVTSGLALAELAWLHLVTRAASRELAHFRRAPKRAPEGC